MLFRSPDHQRVLSALVIAQEKTRIIEIMLAACRGGEQSLILVPCTSNSKIGQKDLQVAALTGGRSSLEPALFQYQLEICLMQGMLFVAGRRNKIDGVLLAFGPGQDIYPKYT